MKKQLCVLLAGLLVSLSACADGYYYSPYGYGRQPVYGNGGYRPPVYSGYAYPRAYPNYGYHEHRDFDRDRGWGGNGWGERREWRERHEGGEGRGWGRGYERG